jgi:hypothetical protein
MREIKIMKNHKKKKKWLADEELYRLHQDIGAILLSERERMEINRGASPPVKRALKAAEGQALIF